MRRRSVCTASLPSGTRIAALTVPTASLREPGRATMLRSLPQRLMRLAGAPTVLVAGLVGAALAASAPDPLSVSPYRAQAGTICTNEEKQLNGYQAHGSLAKKLVEEVEFESRTSLATYRAFARL